MVRLVEEAYHVVQPHVRERQQLVDLFFEERLEYPAFAWQEAIEMLLPTETITFKGLESKSGCSMTAWKFAAQANSLSQ